MNQYLKYVLALGATAIGLYAATATAAAEVNSASSESPPALAPAPEVEPTQTTELVPAKPVSDADLWQRIRRGFAMNELNSPLVQDHEQWYANRPEYIQRFVDRGSRYLYHVVEEVERRGMPTEVALLPIIESAFNPQAYSRAKAAGMWQFIPSTGKHFGLKQEGITDNRRDVLLSTSAALDYLQKLYGMFNSWELAFAAYNCGEGCVGRAIQKNERKGLPTDFLSLNLPPETRNYVPKLIAIKNIVLAPGSYGIELNSVENRPYFAKVAAPSKIDVKLAAKLADMAEDEFAALNPASSKPVAASSTGYFLVPADKADTFRENLELYRSFNGPLVSWQTASAKRGESVENVAKRYGMTASYLRATNGPFKERKGKLTQPISFLVPMPKEAKIIYATLDQKLALKAAKPQMVRVAEIADASIASEKPLAATEPVAIVAANVVIENTPPPIPSIAAPPTSYRVQKGDTLFSIATRFSLSVDQIRTANALKNNVVRIGQDLALSGEETIAAAPATLLRVSAPAQPVATKISTYVIKNGDTLFGIAIKFGVELGDLLRWNKLTHRSVLQPGKRLRIS